MLLSSISSNPNAAEILATPFDKGLTVLHIAVQLGNVHTTSYLLQHDADVNAMDHGGWTVM